jgi:hypothetical protein
MNSRESVLVEKTEEKGVTCEASGVRVSWTSENAQLEWTEHSIFRECRRLLVEGVAIVGRTVEELKLGAFPHGQRCQNTAITIHSTLRDRTSSTEIHYPADSLWIDVVSLTISCILIASNPTHIAMRELSNAFPIRSSLPYYSYQNAWYLSEIGVIQRDCLFWWLSMDIYYVSKSFLHFYRLPLDSDYCRGGFMEWYWSISSVRRCSTYAYKNA